MTFESEFSPSSLSSVTTTVMKVKGCFSPLSWACISQLHTPPCKHLHLYLFSSCRNRQRPCSCTPHIVAALKKSSVSVVHPWIVVAGELHKLPANKLKVAFLGCQKELRGRLCVLVRMWRYYCLYRCHNARLDAKKKKSVPSLQLSQ